MPIVFAISKYGERHFKVELLEEVKDGCSQTEVDSREVYWVKKLDSFSPNGYNLRAGQSSGILSAETRKKISIANTGKKASPETIEKLRKSHLGYKMSDATKKKLSKANLGKVLSDEHRDKIRNSNTGKKYSKESKSKMSKKKRKFIYEIVGPDEVEYITDNLWSFCKEHGLNAGHMWSVSVGKASHHKQWKILGKKPI